MGNEEQPSSMLILNHFHKIIMLLTFLSTRLHILFIFFFLMEECNNTDKSIRYVTLFQYLIDF